MSFVLDRCPHRRDDKIAAEHEPDRVGIVIRLLPIKLELAMRNILLATAIVLASSGSMAFAQKATGGGSVTGGATGTTTGSMSGGAIGGKTGGTAGGSVTGGATGGTTGSSMTGTTSGSSRGASELSPGDRFNDTRGTANPGLTKGASELSPGHMKNDQMGGQRK